MWYFYISSKVYNILLERLLYFLCWRAVSIHPPGSTFCFPLRSGAVGCCKWISHGYRIAKHIVIRCSRCQRITRPPFTGDVMASKRKGKELSRHTANRNEINLGQEDKISLRRKNGIWITIRNSILHFLKLDRNGKITIRTEEQKSPESHSKGSVAANILKGAAAAGLAVGGTAITQGMDVQAAEAATEMTVDTPRRKPSLRPERSQQRRHLQRQRSRTKLCTRIPPPRCLLPKLCRLPSWGRILQRRRYPRHRRNRRPLSHRRPLQMSFPIPYWK